MSIGCDNMLQIASVFHLATFIRRYIYQTYSISDNFHDFLMENNESLNMPVLESVYFLLNQTKNEFFKEQIKVTLFTIEMS